MRLLLICLVLFAIVNCSYSQKQNSNQPVKIIFDGEVYKSFYYPKLKFTPQNNSQDNSSAFNSISFKQLSTLRNYYDLESNGTPLQIWQDPANPDNIHAVYTYSEQESGWSDRTVQYFFSSDRGASWSYISNIPNAGRSGFGTITGLSTGVAFIGLHSGTGASSNIRTQFYVDAFPGLGSFTNLNPGGENNKYMWPKVVATQNVSQTNKYVFVTSTSGADSAFIGVGTSITSSNFLPYKKFNAEPAECYTLARGTDGRIGIAYVNDGTNDPANTGDIYFIESTNAGSNFSAPLKIFDANFNTDSLAGLRGISMVYKGTAPCVVFETVKQDLSGAFYPFLPSKIRFWSSAINGGNSVVIADQSNVPFAPAIGNTDVEAPICRPSIGISSDGAMLFCSMMVQSSSTGGTDTTSYNDIYLSRSANGGGTWSVPERITPVTPRNDWAYASISLTNDVAGSFYYVNLLMQKDTIPGSNVNLSDPRTNAKPYYVRVSYLASSGPPAVPTLIAPANNAANQSLTPTLSWTSTGESFRLQVSTTSGFTNVIVDQSLNLQTSYQIPTPILTSSATYYWRVSASSPGGSSPFSSPFAFTTTSQAIPAAPVLVTPVSGATNQSVLLSFNWNDVSGAINYRMQVSTNSSFTGVIFDSSNITISQISMPFALNGSTLYYWRVNAKNDAGSGPYSSIFNFTTSPAIPPAPTLVAPQNGLQGVPLTPNLIWNAASGSTSYNVQIATDVNFANMVYQASPTGTSHLVPSGNLALNTLYFWRVRGSNVSGTGPFSTTFNFRSVMSGITSIEGAVPTEYKLFNNYPNPFNPTTKIKFDLPKNSDVKIKIYDLNGRMVHEMLDYTLAAGTYEMTYDASSLASGIYYFRIDAGEFNDTKKMILLK